MKPNTGMKLNREKKNAFSSRTAVYQPSLFAEENGVVAPSPSLSRVNSKAIQELNALVTAQYDMSPLERRLLSKVIEHLPVGLRYLGEWPVVEPILLSRTEVVKGLGIPKGEEEEALEKAGQKLIAQVCWISHEEGTLQAGLLGSVQLLKGKDVIRVSVDPLVYPYLKKIKAYFDVSQLETLIQFKSFYSKCLYELFRKSVLSREGLYFPLAQLKQLLLIEPQEYERYNDLKRFVLKRAEKDLKSTPMAFTIREKRTIGQKVLGVHFMFLKLNPLGI